MAIIKVEATKRGPVKEVMTVVDKNEDQAFGEPYWVATCVCGVIDTDRGNFEDTVQLALLHIETRHE